MNTVDQSIRIRLYSVDYTHHSPEDLDRLTNEFWHELNSKFEGNSRIVSEKNIPDGAKMVVVGVVGGLIVEHIVSRSIEHIASILFEFVREWLKEKKQQGNIRAKVQVGSRLIDLTPTMQKGDIEAQLRRIDDYSEDSSATGRRLALIVGNTQYTDSKLTRLNAPQADAHDLARVLKDGNIGGFNDVQVLLNEPSSKVKQSIELLFREKASSDLLFLYFSGHGIKDENGNLYLATSDTRHDFVRSTGISAGFIKESMGDSPSRRKVLVLDCCYSGAFVQGAKSAAAIGSRINAPNVFHGSGYGQVVLTASDTMQIAWEGNKIIGNTANSYFTHYLIEGLRSGKADVDKDGRISVTELYSYIHDKVIGKQTPNMSSTEMVGNIFLARNPRPSIRPEMLPQGLINAYNSPDYWQREGAIIEFERLLGSNDPMVVNTAHAYLKKLTEDDSRKVSIAAQQALARYANRSRPDYQQPSPPSDATHYQNYKKPPIPNNGSTYRENQNQYKLESSENTSGFGKFATVPDEIKGKWNWGAFLLSWIWGIGNSTWITFIVFIPYVGFVLPFLLGVKGNEWAWRNKQWDNVEHFQKVQKKWRNWGIALAVVGCIFFLCMMLTVAIEGY